jgi:formylglycine-generating enzyme required for sulfatase activity
MGTAVVLASLAQAAEIWEPAVSTAGVVPERTRIVKLGMETHRNDDGSMFSISSMHRYRVVTNATTGLRDAEMASTDRQEFHDYDVDGDGIATNDTAEAHVFSLTRTLSPDGPFYDTSIGTHRMYGGTVIYTANTTNPYGYSEDGMNDYEEGAAYQPRRNWTLFNEVYAVNEPFRMYGVWLWKKEDFLNGGADYPVSFGTNSSLNHLVMRYYMGIEGFRWVVRNNEQFYISQEVYQYADEIPGETGGKVHTIRPLATQWAEYNPSGYRIDFNTNIASYVARNFTNVTAVGYYMFKDSLIPGYVGYKWYTFDAFATVNRPKRPSERLAMAEITGSGGVQNFYLSTCEVPYTLWRKVYRLANNNVFCSSPRGTVNFDNDGDQGSQDYPDTNGVYLSHGPNEPVTDVTFYDTLAWCNALSVQETREPVSYTDAGFSNIFSHVQFPPFWLNAPTNRPVIYVKWSADGFRLPTPKEWERAHDAGAQQYTATYGWMAANATGTTHAAGGLATNALGLYDMAGNVWEMVWPFGNALDPQSSPVRMALGGDLHYPNSPTNYSASAYGDEPYDGNYNIGFRLVRREAGLGAPDTSTNISSAIPKWTIAANARNATVPSRQLAAPLSSNWIPQIDVPGTNFAAGITEVTFAQWKPVYDWAKNNGYVFDYDGQMGSVDYWGWNGAGAWTSGSHGPNEPVTSITRYDAITWLNALSELEGRTQVYLTGAGGVIKTSYVYRPLQKTLASDVIVEGFPTPTNVTVMSYANTLLWPSNTVLSSANGYRLPDGSEFYYTAHCGGSAKYPWGTDIKLATNYAWTIDNSGLRTHPVAQLQPNAWGFYDMLGNVSEMSESSVGKLGFLARERLGPGFFDLTDGYPYVMDRSTFSGLCYPDTGFRVFRQKP